MKQTTITLSDAYKVVRVFMALRHQIDLAFTYGRDRDAQRYGHNVRPSGSSSVWSAGV